MSAIPYTVERRSDTGVNNVQAGIWLFLASELMLFGALFSAYVMLRAGAPTAWVPLSTHLGRAAINTVVLVAAGVLVAVAARGPAPRLPLLGSTLAALVFCVSKVSEYRGFAAAGLVPASSTQMATYYLLTGVHVLHVFGGMAANVWVAASAGAPLPGVRNRIAALRLYWLFVDAVWLAIVVSLYVV